MRECRQGQSERAFQEGGNVWLLWRQFVKAAGVTDGARMAHLYVEVKVVLVISRRVLCAWRRRKEMGGGTYRKRRSRRRKEKRRNRRDVW